MSNIQSGSTGWINNLPFFKAVFRSSKADKITRGSEFPELELQGENESRAMMPLALPVTPFR